MTLRDRVIRDIFPPFVVVALLIVSLGVYLVDRSPTVTCYGRSAGHLSGSKSLGLTLTSTRHSNPSTPSTTLPPSRDNDAGISRERDATPDADADTYQRLRVCLENGHRVKAP